MEDVRVIVVDDNIQLRDMVAEYLKMQNGLEVVAVAENGLDAIEAVKKHEPDVLICDMIKSLHYLLFVISNFSKIVQYILNLNFINFAISCR